MALEPVEEPHVALVGGPSVNGGGLSICLPHRRGWTGHNSPCQLVAHAATALRGPECPRTQPKPVREHKSHPPTKAAQYCQELSLAALRWLDITCHTTAGPAACSGALDRPPLHGAYVAPTWLPRGLAQRCSPAPDDYQYEQH